MKTYITRINGGTLKDKSHLMQHMIAETAYQLGCMEMGIYRYCAENENAQRLNVRIDGIIAGINRGDLVICQFPTGNGLRFENELVNHLKAYGGRIAIFIHELEVLSQEEKRSLLSGVIGLYNKAEVLIVPTYEMWQWLLDNGIQRSMKFVVQEMWDYMVNEPLAPKSPFKKEIYFTDGEGFTGINIHNLEEREPNQLFYELSKGGGFGLVWYRDECSKKYMELSNSFSVARYLAAGIPVIVPVDIPQSTLVEENHLGLVVNSLEEAAAVVDKLPEEEYWDYVKSVEEFAPAVRSGYYTKKWLIEAMRAFYRKDAGGVLVPGRVYSIGENVFESVVLKESYGGNLALSWTFKGDAAGFLIYDTLGFLVGETRNIYQHYFLIKGGNPGKGFIVKAYVDTLKGKMVVAESASAYLETVQYNAPTVSLLIPAYNAEEFIARSVDTALAQTFSDLEVIVVDDGSKDNTLEIIEWYAKKYPNVISIHQENRGTAAARNAGIEHANGDYIGFMDSDDMIRPDMMARLYDSAKTNDCDIALTSLYLIKNEIYEPFIKYPIKGDTAFSMEEFFQMHFDKGCIFAVVVVNKLYKASLVKEHFLPLMPMEDDAWTPYVLSYANRICYIDDCLYEYDRTIRNSTISDEVQKKPKDELFRIYRDAVMFYMNNGNFERREFLKKLAKRNLSEMGHAYHYGEYEKLWKQIEESY